MELVPRAQPARHVAWDAQKNIARDTPNPEKKNLIGAGPKFALLGTKGEVSMFKLFREKRFAAPIATLLSLGVATSTAMTKALATPTLTQKTTVDTTTQTKDAITAIAKAPPPVVTPLTTDTIAKEVTDQAQKIPQTIFTGTPPAVGLPVRQSTVVQGGANAGVRAQLRDGTLDLDYWNEPARAMMKECVAREANLTEAEVECIPQEIHCVAEVEEGQPSACGPAAAQGNANEPSYRNYCKKPAKSAVAKCLADVQAVHLNPCKAPSAQECVTEQYYRSYCGRREQVQQWNNDEWHCIQHVQDAIDALAMQENVTVRESTLPDTMYDERGQTTQHYLEHAETLVKESPPSAYYEWDAFIRQTDPEFALLRGTGLTPPDLDSSSTETDITVNQILLSVIEPPDRFTSNIANGEAIASCQEAAAEKFHDMTMLETDLRRIDKKRSPRFLVDRIFYGGPRDGVANNAPLVTYTPTTNSVQVAANFHDLMGQSISVPRTYRSWRSTFAEDGVRKTFKNAYWLIDKESQMPIDWTSHDARRRLRKHYRMDLSWHYKMAEALRGYSDEDLIDLERKQIELLDKYKHYYRLKAYADCRHDGRSIHPAGEICGAQGPRMSEGTQASFSAQAGFTSQRGSFVTNATHPQTVGSSDPIRDQLGVDDQMQEEFGPGQDYPHPDEDRGRSPDEFIPNRDGPTEPDPIPEDPRTTIPNRDEYLICRDPLMEALTFLETAQCPDEDDQQEYRRQADEYFAEHIAPELERARLMGCLPDDPNEPTPCDWAPVETARFFEQMYVSQRLEWFHYCAEEFGTAPLTAEDFRTRFIDPHALPAHQADVLGSLPQWLKEDIVGYRNKNYLANPTVLFSFPGDFDAYRLAVAETVFGEGGVLSEGGLRSSSEQEKSVGNDFIGISMQAMREGGHVLAEILDRCDTGVTARTSVAIHLDAFNMNIDLANLAFEGGTGERQGTQFNPLHKDNDNKWDDGGDTFGLSLSAGHEAIFEPASGGQPVTQRGFRTTISLSASYGLAWEPPGIPVPMGTLEGEITFGVSGTVGLSIAGSAEFRQHILPRELREQDCENPSSVTLSAAVTPSIGAYFFIAFSVGTPGPVSLQIGIKGTLTIAQLAYEMSWSERETNYGEVELENGEIIPISDASSDTRAAMMLTILAGAISIFVKIKAAFVSITLFEFVLIRFGGIRIPLTKQEKTFDGVDKCMVSELQSLIWRTRPALERCPCVFRNPHECKEKND